MRNIEESTVRAVLEDWRTAPIPERLRAALGLLEAMTRRPGQRPTAELAACKAAELDAEAVEDAANIGFHFNLINRVADAFDFPLPNEQQLPKVGMLLDRAGNIFGGKRLEPSWCVGADGMARPVEVEDGRTRMLTMPGQTTPALRRAVEAHVARRLGGWREADDDAPLATEAGPASDALVPYLDKLARHAYRIVDEDVAALQAAGFGEEAIFELTMVAATGAALVGLESVLAGLVGAEAMTGATAVVTAVATTAD